LRDTILETGTITVCTQCALRRDITADDLLPGVRIAGSTTFADEVMADGARALVY
jgi:predicted peroxiredoxin